MRLPRLFAKLPGLKPPAPELRFAVDRTRIFDQEKTRALRELLEIPRGRRDPAWTERFFDAAWNASLVVADPAVITGPDGFPYLRLDMPPTGRFKAASIANLAAICLERATGIALFASPSDPVGAYQFVFPPGMLDSLVRFDTWSGDPLDHTEVAELDGSVEQGWGRSVTLREAHEVMLGSPSVQYLPTYTARALMNQMRLVWKIAEPRVRLLVDPKLRPSRNLVVGRKRSEFAAGESWDDQCRRLLWYLPQGRSVVLMPEDWRLDDMTPLVQLAGEAPGPKD